MPDDDSTTTVLVCGAGPVGLTAAIDCLRHGLRVRIIDKALTKDPHSKAFGIHALTMEKFVAMGVAPAVLAEAQCVDRIKIRGRFATVVEDFSYIPSRFKGAFMLSQRKLEDILEAQVELYGVEVERGVELLDLTQPPAQGEKDGETTQEAGPSSSSSSSSSNSSQTLTTARLRDVQTGQERSLACKYVIGSDGSHSSVRKLLKIPFTGAPYEEDFLLLDTHFTLKPGMKFGGTSLLLGEPFIAMFQIAPDILRFVTKRCDGDGIPHSGNDQSIKGVENIEVEAAILRRIESLALTRCPELESFRGVEWASIFRVHRRVVPRYSVGNVFLAGDAAHIHSPFGGQGLNTGVHDAVNLAWKLGVVEKLGGDAEVVLGSYHEERHPVGEETLAWTDSLTSLTVVGGWFTSVVQNVLFPLVSPLLNRSQWVMEKMTTRMSMLSLSYRGTASSLLSSSSSSSSFPVGCHMPGDRARDGPLIRLSSGTATGLLEVMCGGLKHTLLLFGEEEEDGGEGGGEGAVRAALGKEGEERLWGMRDVVALVHISRRFHSVSKAAAAPAGAGDVGISSSSSSSSNGNGGSSSSSSSSSSSRRKEVLITSFYDDVGRVTQAFGLEAPTDRKGKPQPLPPCLFLIRPDGYVAWRAVGWNLGELLDYLDVLFPGRRSRQSSGSSCSSSSSSGSSSCSSSNNDGQQSKRP
jgi:2-polyprenyl-6-methoxyphenol hydroxylase-like FAD-dependent oxidoreductase